MPLLVSSAKTWHDACKSIVRRREGIGYGPTMVLGPQRSGFLVAEKVDSLKIGNGGAHEIQYV